ncbi:MAG: hypothetical protein ACP5R5_08865 [Armatimonadota bacterium]
MRTSDNNTARLGSTATTGRARACGRLTVMRTEVSVLSRKILLTLLLGPVVCSSTWASSIAYQRVRHGRLLAHVVTVNLADPEVKVSVALAAGGAEAVAMLMGHPAPGQIE